MGSEITPELLEEIDQELAGQGVPVRRRPWQALLTAHRRLGISSLISGPAVAAMEGFFGWRPDDKIIQEWYVRHYPKEHLSPFPAMFSVFYHRGVFWEMAVPLVFGAAFPKEPLRSLTDMPAPTMEALVKDRRHLIAFMEWWSKMIGYSFGLMQARLDERPDSLGLQFFRAGKQDIPEIASLMADKTGSGTGANRVCRDAVENFLKSFLAFKGIIETDKQARKEYSHGLAKALDKCAEVSNRSGVWEGFEPRLRLLPAVGDRYHEQAVAPANLWDNYRLAVEMGTAVMVEIFGITPAQFIPWDPHGKP